MSQYNLIPQTTTIPFRLPRTGKHSAGTPAPKIFGRRPKKFRPGHPKRMADLSPAAQQGIRTSNATAKQEFITTGVRDANNIAAQRAQDKLIRDWVYSLDGDEHERVKATGILKPLADPFPRSRADHEEDETRERDTSLVESYRHNGKSIYLAHEILNGADRAAAVEDMSPEEIEEAHAAFGRAMAWVHVPQLLVKKGRRLAVVIAYFRPDLGEELPICQNLTRDFAGELVDFNRELVAMVFGRVFAWCRDAASLSALGIRASIIAYVIRPQLLDAATNEQIGKELNNTRAAINKLVQEFRDTFAGIRGAVMRDEDTRAACRQAQFA